MLKAFFGSVCNWRWAAHAHVYIWFLITYTTSILYTIGSLVALVHSIDISEWWLSNIRHKWKRHIKQWTQATQRQACRMRVQCTYTVIPPCTVHYSKSTIKKSRNSEKYSALSNHGRSDIWYSSCKRIVHRVKLVYSSFGDRRVILFHWLHASKLIDADHEFEWRNYIS